MSLLIFISKIHTDSLLDEYTLQEKLLINDYLSTTKDNIISDHDLIKYVQKTIQENSDFMRKRKSFNIIENYLYPNDKILFEDICINFVVTFLTNGTIEKGEPLNALVRALYALGAIRTEKSIRFLENLIVPMEIWVSPDPKEVKFKENIPYDHYNEIIRRVRYGAQGAILSIGDQITIEMIPKLKEKISQFENDSIQHFLLERLEWYSKKENTPKPAP